jgi:E2/UBC family protein E
MATASFLPEDDQDFLQIKGIKHTLHEEDIGNGERRYGVEFIEQPLPPNLYVRSGNGHLVPGSTVSVLVLIPKGYAKTQLDSWYVFPAVFLGDGQAADRANGEAALFGRTWQFWSRHLASGEWREGVDGLETYLQYIRSGLRNP